MSDIKPEDIETLLEAFEASGWSEMTLKIDGLELFLSTTPGARASLSSPASTALAPSAATLSSAPPSPPPTAAPAGATRVGDTPETWARVCAPNLGTFYRSPKPGAPPYVTVGQHVEASTELCLIEVMKLFTSVAAGVPGVLRQVLVEDAQLVEFDQALFLIEPDA